MRYLPLAIFLTPPFIAFAFFFLYLLIAGAIIGMGIFLLTAITRNAE